ncbi:ParB N-terminal domain-containing protein [Aporhodopirellula aestuarii]|uniref:ParB/RepB/Spo0J family partition protein n=1 Tax=Aporhodopirellula aestuarii TaxID=2950107 RepID=A0ABT0U162_9BACT|nr:ParB/RepB/Spo0J family partition protein [Aporhodopirellula aestuarii]MCM2370374.1 ParB/RepB/Spo0J family partition protein [Aporhodopirellula aestuarii]
MSDAVNNNAPKSTIPSLDACLAELKALITGAHEACLSVPEMGAEDFGNLIESIKEYGLLIPILVDRERRLLDGRRRILACHAAGVRLEEAMIDETDETPEAIAETNFARRHLTQDQRAMNATELLPSFRDAAKKRKMAGGEKGA